MNCITLDTLPVDSSDLQKAISKDPVLTKVYDYVLHGWPNHPSDQFIKPYFRCRNELSVENRCLLWGLRVVIPMELRDESNSWWHNREEFSNIIHDELQIFIN